MRYLDKFKQAIKLLFPTRRGKNEGALWNGRESGNSAREHLPVIHVLATGGTIAGKQADEGYRAGALSVEALIESVPLLRDMANIQCEQVANIGSQEMNDEVWLALARRINELLACRDVHGIVITHGTDTLEETAWFLDLTVNSAKPVVLVGAMRPADAPGADGPANLLDAARVALSSDSVARGVLVVMHGCVFEARDVTKVSTVDLQAFAAPNSGPLGRVLNGQVSYGRHLPRVTANRTVFDVSGLESLPPVGIVYGHANASGLPVQALIDAGYRGIVSAGVGNGNLHSEMLAALADAVDCDIGVVRASRVASGPTLPNVEVNDARHGFVAAGTLNPQKARILLQLALTRTQEPGDIQKIFDAC
ncbi:MAG: type II asparaginase [Azoarcus sp.]|jgi:L-asparaginase|nr:type II asparaginase [Azoarcus sp.]